MRSNLPHLDIKTDYFLKCCKVISDEWGIPFIINREEVEILFCKLSRRTRYVSIGDRFIWNFVTYVFYSKTNTRAFTNFKFNWLLTSTAVRAWFEKPDDWYVYHGRWIAECGLKMPTEIKNINPRSTEEVFRRKFLNTPRGFITCLENTSLSDPESRICRICMKKLDCRKILKENNPNLYKERYGGTERSFH
jgi:hypothetical protein